MRWFLEFIDSSIGKKIVMALTGLFLSLFLIGHLTGNLLLLAGDGGIKFEEYAKFMSDPGNIPVRIIEIGLFAIIIFHTINGFRLAIENRKARKEKYDKVDASANSSFASRFMVKSGIIVFVFLVVHLGQFFVPHRITGTDETMFETVKAAFENPIYSGFYVLAMILLAIHLAHGVQSAFQTLGIRNNKITPILKNLGVIFAVVICLGFAIIPIYFLMGMGD